MFKLGGKVQLPPMKAEEKAPDPPPVTASEQTIARGAQLFANTCAQCHGQQAMGGVKDLRKMTRETHAKFNDIVLKGIYQEKGMASFADLLKPDAGRCHSRLSDRAGERGLGALEREREDRAELRGGAAIGMKRHFAALAAGASLFVGANMAAAQPPPADLTVLPPVPKSYVPKKTSWGDPDFEGIFPLENIDLARIRLTRPSEYGNRFC